MVDLIAENNQIIYVIDTSALIYLQRHNPIKIILYSQIWNHIENLIANQTLVSPVHVKFELERGDDELYNWIKKYKNFFKDFSELYSFAKLVIDDYWQIGSSTKTYHADPYIIGLAKYYFEVYGIQSKIVTEENSSNEGKIPWVAKRHGIESLKFIKFLEEVSP